MPNERLFGRAHIQRLGKLALEEKGLQLERSEQEVEGGEFEVGI